MCSINIVKLRTIFLEQFIILHHRELLKITNKRLFIKHWNN